MSWAMMTIWATMTRSPKKKSSTRRLPRIGPLHLFLSPGHLSEWSLIPIAVLLLTLNGWPALASPDFPHPEQKKQPKPVFVLYGTVFTPQGFGMQGAEVTVRRAGEKPDKKPRWRAVSDRRGEFAFYVPPGAEYEVQVSASGYKIVSRKVDAREGERHDMVFRLEPSAQK